VIVASGIASTLMARVGFRSLLAGAMLLLAAGLVWFAQIDPGGEYVSDVLARRSSGAPDSESGSWS
jgi:hypothetical protein